MPELLAIIPAQRRDAAYREICRIVNEVSAADRSLEGVGEGLAVDEALEEICELIAGELQRARKVNRLASLRRAKCIGAPCPAC